MPSKKYNLVEDPESRVPLVPEEAFQHGIPYNVKFIGAMDIPRPTSRVEIVAAMRRVRFEFKAKGIKKRKVTLTVSTDGIRTCVRKKSRNKKKQMNGHNAVDIVLESHPIYRIFYVSHDSQDVKIFSYIARETSTSTFHCVVFKASNKDRDLAKTSLQKFLITGVAVKLQNIPYRLFHCCGISSEIPKMIKNAKKLLTASGNSKKLSFKDLKEDDENVLSSTPEEPQHVVEKNQATKVVRTVGQAFEVSHKLNGPFESDGEGQDPARGVSKPQHSSEESSNANSRKSGSVEKTVTKNLGSPQKKIPPPINVIDQINEYEQDEYAGSLQNLQQPSTPVLKEYANIHELKLLREKLEQSTQATNAALAQVNLLRDQLQAESNARIEAQTRTHQLLQHNKELLDHLQSLVNHIQELEGNYKKTSSTCSISPAPLPQVMATSFQEIESLRRQNAALLETILYENSRLSYPHYFMYPHHPPPPPATPSHLYSSLLINNPHIPFTPQTNSSSSSPNKFYEDFSNIFNRSASHHSNTPGAVAAAAAGRAGSAGGMTGADITTFAGIGVTKPPSGIDTSTLNRQLFERQMSPMRRQAFGDSASNAASSSSGGPPGGVQRSVSEKINHRSELMSQVQRSVWARHTTK